MSKGYNRVFLFFFWSINNCCIYGNIFWCFMTILSFGAAQNGQCILKSSFRVPPIILLVFKMSNSHFQAHILSNGKRTRSTQVQGQSLSLQWRHWNYWRQKVSAVCVDWLSIMSQSGSDRLPQLSINGCAVSQGTDKWPLRAGKSEISWEPVTQTISKGRGMSTKSTGGWWWGMEDMAPGQSPV